MKKYFAGIGLLLAALMFFGCKLPAEQQLTKLPDEQVVSVAKSVLDDTAYKFDSGFTVQISEGEKVEFYAARLPEKDKAVSTLFNPAYFAASEPASSVSADKIKVKVGGAFSIGDRFNVGYRLIDKNGKILRSKVVAVDVISASKFYVEVKAAELKYALNKWQVEVKLKESKERRASLVAKLALGGSEKATKEIGEKKAVVTGDSPNFVATFTWDVPAETIKSFAGVPIHAILTVKDIEIDDVNAKCDMVVSLAKSQVYNPDNPAAADWLFETDVVTKAGSKETVKLLEATDPVVITVKPEVKINNSVKNVPSDQAIEGKIIYNYAFSTVENKDNVPADVWQTIEVNSTDTTFNVKPADNLEYNTKYYLHLKATYVTKTKDASAGVETLKTEKLDSIVGPSFKTLNGLNAAGWVYDMKTDKTSISTTHYMLVGSLSNSSNVPYVKDVPAALKTNGTKDGASLQLDNGKNFDSYKQTNYKYNSGALSFKMRLPNKTEGLNTILQTAPKLLSKDGKVVNGANGNPVSLAEFSAEGVMAQIAYYPPTFKSNNADTSGSASAKWELYEKASVKLIIIANADQTVSAAEVLSTTGVALTSATALDSVTAAQVAFGTGVLKEVTFDENKWVDWLNCEIVLTNLKITVKADSASADVTFKKANHFTLIDSGFDTFSLTSKLDKIRVKDVKYTVTK